MDNIQSVHDHEKQRNFNTGAAMVALVAALLAGGVAWAAYNRSGEDLEDQAKTQADKAVAEVKETTINVTNQVETAAMNTKQEATRSGVEDDLSAIQIKLAAGNLTQEAKDDLASEVASIRNDLLDGYENSSTQVMAQVNTIATELQSLENDLRAGAAKSLTIVESTLEKVRNDLMTDDESMNENTTQDDTNQ
jgi:hypothetical protein